MYGGHGRSGTACGGSGFPGGQQVGNGRPAPSPSGTGGHGVGVGAGNGPRSNAPPTPAAANASEAARITQSASRRRIHEDDAGDARLVPLAPCSARGGRRHGRGGLPLVAVALAAALGLSSAALAIVLVARRI